MSDAKLGLWKEDDISATVARYTGNRYYHSLPDNVQFIHSVGKILAIRNARDASALCSAPSFYVLGPVPEGIQLVPKREPTFSLGGVNVAGKVWFGAAAMNSSNGFSIPSDADADVLFTFVSETLASGTRSAIYFDGSTNDVVLRFYPNGVDNPDDCEDILFGGKHINEATVKAMLDRIHERSLITPTASMASRKLWKDGTKCFPAERPEGAIQEIVEIGLGNALGNVRVKREETGIYGRFDLALIEQDPLEPTKTINHAILELKVVKSFTHTGNEVSDAANHKAVLKGLKQAFSYQKEHGSRISAVCCYDMRQSHSSGDKCRYAAKLGVEFWAWPLFSTTEASRNSLVENHLNSKP